MPKQKGPESIKQANNCFTTLIIMLAKIFDSGGMLVKLNSFQRA